MFRTALISMFITSVAIAETWTVDDDGKADFDNIQAAVDASSDGDEIIVMPGTYTGIGDQVVNTYPVNWLTLRSSGGPDETIIDGEGVRRGILCNYEDNESEWAPVLTLTGFTIRNGFSVGGGVWGGGGMNCQSINVQIANCKFINNTANDGGAGLLLTHCEADVTNCDFTNNINRSSGGGMYVTVDYSGKQHTTITNCNFVGNQGRFGGGLTSLNEPGPTIVGCTFDNNTATAWGGGMFTDDSDSSITNCIFKNNLALSEFEGEWKKSSGGAIYSLGYHATLTGCILQSNIAVGGGGGIAGSAPTLLNTVVCGNSPDQLPDSWVDLGGNTIADNCSPPTSWTVDDDGKADFNNIQAAVDAAIQGDEIIVMPGTYTGTGDNVVDMLGKLVWLHSSDGPEVTFINGEGQRRGILSESFETSKTIIEGFTIQNGYATDWNGDGNWPGHHGAGMLCDSSNPTITNCTFANNLADNGDGGGLYLISSSSTVTGCVFINNSTAWHGGGVTVVSDSFGGFSNPLISNCNFSGNTAEGGGGLCCYDDGLTIEYCTFDANIAGHGGGMYTDYCDPTLTVTNCTFTNNVATGDGFDEGYGGGMDNWASNFTLTGCVFRSNIAGIGGAIRNNVAPKGEDSSNTTLTDTLVCGNSLEQISGQWTDHGGNTVAEECPIDCTSDINVDGNVDVNDLLILIADWGTCTDNCVGDVNEDGTVDVNDLLILIAAWGPCE